jgi:outer membrane lipoprotein SlyB
MTTRRIVLLIGTVLAVAPVGCSHMNQTEKGVLGGGAIGAGVGTLIGHATGNPKTGAVVGGLLGAGVGGAIGNESDRKDEEAKEVRQAAAQHAYADAQPNRVSEIIQLTNSGQDEVVILNHIRNNRMTFHLSVDDLNLLKANNVSPRVIAAMQNGAGEVPARVSTRPIVVREQVVVREPVYVTPPPPVFYGPPPVVFHGRFR